ncbi:hypothetical protein L4X63_21870 [Geomonas sp. Red32]|uniref:hypothetical protein n=1 Tax=Geomonas sp. Red32 TaxID=2912856 RepID=UPI00202CB321|nr:hypothetical protein [Geomonas sp. Red32]MCM0084235.1 hypothetical protein [Geomonas sp. Red32]
MLRSKGVIGRVFLLLACALWVVAATGITAAAEPAGQGEAMEIPSPVKADRWQGHASYVFGYKFMESGWAPADGQAEIGLVDVDVQKESWPVSFACQMLLTYSDYVPDGMAGNTSGVWEVNLGIRKFWVDSTYPSLRSFAGGGLAIVGSTTSTNQAGDTTNEHSSAGPGFWLDAGLYWNFVGSLDLGVQLQYTRGYITLAGRDLDAGGLHLLGMIGYHWGY